jgi:hypothetical protein
MANTFRPRFITAAEVTFHTTGTTAVEYACSVKRAELVPSAGKESEYRTLCPDGTFRNLGASTWSLELEGAQDWAAAGLSRFLFDHEGEELTFQVDQYGNPHDASDAEPEMTGTVRAVAPGYGGAVDEYAEFSVSLPVVGKPTLGTGATAQAGT